MNRRPQAAVAGSFISGSLVPFLWLVAGFACAVGRLAADDAAKVDFFEKRIRPVLVERCFECHSTKSKSLEGDLSLESRNGLLDGGERGPAVVPGDPDKSLLIQAIRYDDESLHMPPKEPLPKDVIADFEAWVKDGAVDPRQGAPSEGARYDVNLEEARKHWPFTPVSNRSLPEVRHAEWSWNAVDRLLLAKMEEHQLAPGSDADRRTLIRRVTFDLTGLPPTPEEVDAFLADPSPLAYPRLVERLMNSAAYGERWGRFWLDVVRYADTAGDNSDYPIPQIYKYRNWVIQAFMEDKPFDQFIREQIAGDLLPSSNLEQKHQQIIATGYLANARRFGSRVADYPQHLTIEDTIDNLGRAYLGMSLSCARCHNHKFDPITNEDYYALYGYFHSTRYPWPGIELDKVQRDFVPLVSDEEVAEVNRQRQTRQNELAEAVKQVEQRKKESEKSVDALNKELEALRGANREESDEVRAIMSQLAEASPEQERIEKELAAARNAREEFERTPLPYESAYAMAEGKKIENVKVQLKGDPERLGAEVPRRIPRVFGDEVVTGQQTSGRLQLANWIASASNPLTARVMVNRIWQYHFGQGLVATPNDFGKQGRAPSHPELLDYLARFFIENGWSIKAMHRLIVLSHAYQLDSTATSDAAQTDPANTWLSHFQQRRLEAEAIRDTMLFLGGTLDRRMGGPHPFPPAKDWNFTQHNPFKAVYDTQQRSVYLMTQRIQRHPFLALFDGPDTSASTGKRGTSTTPLQALYLLNDAFIHDQAARFAGRLAQMRSEDADRIELAYEMAYARPPTSEELKSGQEYLARLGEHLTRAGNRPDVAARQSWHSFVRSLFRTNEFIYIN